APGTVQAAPVPHPRGVAPVHAVAPGRQVQAETRPGAARAGRRAREWPMSEAYLCGAVRTPFGRYGGALSGVRTDELAAAPIEALLARNPSLDRRTVDDVILGCANQAGEDNRNVARMAALLAGLPVEVPGVTVNRLCGSGMEAVVQAARAIRCGEAALVVAGGVESMSRAPFVLSKAAAPFARDLEMADSTLGWRSINPRMRELYGVD